MRRELAPPPPKKKKSGASQLDRQIISLLEHPLTHG